MLFVMSRLPRPVVSLRKLLGGEEAASGSVSSSLLVASGLAERGHAVGLVVLEGQRVTDTRIRTFTHLEHALEWRDGTGPVIWCSWGDAATANALIGAGIRPWMWVQVHVEPRWRRLLESGALEGIVTVSDDSRLPLLRSSAHQRIGRVYNPLHPFFAAPCGGSAERYMSAAVVFAGYLGPTKGAHLVLQMWGEVRERLPHATLTVAGSSRLYAAEEQVGRYGVTSPEFEERYLQPLVDRFGSLSAAGVRLVGLLSPAELRDLYRNSALGLVNFNWTGATETFCCAAVEMLAAELPVLSFARGALPETIGQTGGATLMDKPDLRHTAECVAAMLQAPQHLETMGRRGADAVRSRYDLEHIVSRWEVLLSAGAEQLNRATGPWGQKRSIRYLIERNTGRLGLGRSLDIGIAASRRLLRD
jgi:glycosyltransferase involved in cell wall biosynthesis